MNAQVEPVLEDVLCERPHCSSPATVAASRVDAVRDHWYFCATHAAEAQADRMNFGIFGFSPLYGRALSALQCLAIFPPKHRAVTRRALEARLERAAGRASLEK